MSLEVCRVSLVACHKEGGEHVNKAWNDVMSLETMKCMIPIGINHNPSLYIVFGSSADSSRPMTACT
jgi:hypothetical protein